MTTVGLAQDGRQASFCDGQQMGWGVGCSRRVGGRKSTSRGSLTCRRMTLALADTGDGLREHAEV